MLAGVIIGLAVMFLFFVPLVVAGEWIGSMRKEMKAGLDEIDSRLKAIERTADSIREDLHDIGRKIENSGKLW